MSDQQTSQAATVAVDASAAAAASPVSKQVSPEMLKNGETTAPATDGSSSGKAAKSKKKKKNKTQSEGTAQQQQDEEGPPTSDSGNVTDSAVFSTAGGYDADPSGSAAALPGSGQIPSQDMLMNVIEQLKLSSLKPAKTPEEALNKSFKFWSTQPVPRMDEKIAVNEPIEADKPISEIRAEPYTLPDGFTWDTMNLNDPLQLKELYTLLNENYVEDDDAMFRFDYQPTFLKWALQPPGWRAEWHCGVRVVKSGRLVGFISAIPGTLNVHQKNQKMVEINFLCVHKKLRSKRLAPVLIREITRRVNMTGIFQAVYTAGVVLPKPVSSCRYWHRSLNPKKLVEVKFSHISRNMTMQRTIKLYKLPDVPKTAGFRKMRESDLKGTHRLLERYLAGFNLTPAFDEDEFRHWFSPQDGIIDCFVVEDPASGEITDMVSYYTLPSTVMHHAVHKCVKAAYSFYNVSTKTPWLDLINDALISARNLNFDVFNALDLMENRKFLVPLKFGIGDGNLQYYLYNWRCPSMQPEDVGLILL